MKVTQLKPFELSDIQKVLKDIYPETYSEFTKNFDLNNSLKLFSPFKIELPKDYLEKIKSFNFSFQKIYKSKLDLLKKNNLDRSFNLRQGVQLAPNFKNQPLILSCLDFHINPETNELKLIEANTNASGYLIGSLVNKLHGFDFKPWFNKLLDMFKKSEFLDADELFVTDENPEQQKMYLEFLLYKEFFKQNRYDLKIIDIKKLDEIVLDLSSTKKLSIYNRSTDFYLKGYKNISDLFYQQIINLNPNPVGYDLLAHKDNLSLISKYNFDIHQLNVTKSKLPQNDFSDPSAISLDLSHSNLTEIDHQNLIDFILHSGNLKDLFPDLESAWKHRKKYFFKPAESYGGKASYKGASVSKKYFEDLWTKNFLAQQYFPAAKFNDNENKEWKYDLRVYIFGNEILFSMARIYQGQITNFSTSGGGFAPVTFY